MAAADIGANFSSYQGNENLGGGSWGVINIDTKPIQTLAAYTMLYNKAEHDQNQKNAEEYAKELAEMAAFDMTTAIPKYRDQIQKGYDDLLAWTAKNSTANDYKKNPELFLERKKKIADFDKLLKAGTTQQTLATVWQQRIEKETNVAEKARLKELHEKDIAAKDIFTPLAVEQQYNLEFKAPPTAKPIEISTMKKDANGVFKVDRTLIDMNYVNAQSELFRLESQAEVLDVNSPEFLKSLEGKTPEEQKLLTEEAKARGNVKPKNGYIEMSRNVMSAMQDPSLLTNGELDLTKAKNSKAVGGIVTLVEQYNARMAQTVSEIESGVYSDGTKPLSFDGKLLNKENYKPINLKDGLDASEFAKIQMVANFTGEKRDISYQQTDDAYQYASLWESARQFNLTPRGSGSGGAAPDVIQDPATLFGAHSLRVANWYKNNKTPNGSLQVPFSASDKETRLATGMDNEKQAAQFHSDGSWTIIATGDYTVKDDKGKVTSTYKKGQIIKKGTAEGLKKGYIDAVKIGQGTDGAQTEGFQQKSEDGFKMIFGSNNADDIFQSFMRGVTPAPAATTAAPANSTQTTTKKTIRRGDIKSKASAAGYTVAEYEKLLIQNGVSITK